jgi:hypothetical protein
MRPIYWGVIWFFIGMVGWVFFSVIVGVGTAFGGQAPPGLWALVYLFGIAFYFSLPVAIIAEVVRWYRRKKAPKALTLVAAPADFTLSLSPESRSVVQGESTTYIVTITVIGAFSQPVLLAAVGLPVGAIGRLEPRTFHPTPGKMAQASTLYLSTNSTATPGEYEISVVATSGTATRAAKSRLVVLYSDPFRQTWQILSNLPDTMKAGIIGAAIGAAGLIIAAIVNRVRRSPGKKGSPNGRQRLFRFG